MPDPERGMSGLPKSPGGDASSGSATYRTLPYPAVQHQGVDWASLMKRQHTIHGLIELDVTETRRAIHRRRRATAEPLSFTALLVATYAHVIGDDPSLQAYRQGKGRVVVFDDVDVAVLVEHIIDGDRVPVPHIAALRTARPHPKSTSRSDPPRARTILTAGPAALPASGSHCRRSSGDSP
jgi:hypothetical protein